MRKRYAAVYATALGKMTLVCSGEGMTSILFGDRIPEGAAEEETPLLRCCHAQLCEYLRGERRKFDLPLMPEGTDFQRAVWNELIHIPYGETRNYSEIAAAIDRPKAARAVGMANHRNPLPILIPCHRVVGKNGGLTGYAWGLERKKILLELEEKHVK